MFVVIPQEVWLFRALSIIAQKIKSMTDRELQVDYEMSWKAKNLVLPSAKRKTVFKWKSAAKSPELKPQCLHPI